MGPYPGQSSASNFIDDGLSGSGPLEGSRIIVVRFDVAHDGVHKLVDAAKGTTPQTLVGEVAEEAFDEVQPRATGRCEMHMEPRMALQPRPDLRVFVSGVVVENDVQLELGRGLLIDEHEKLDPFLM